MLSVAPNKSVDPGLPSSLSGAGGNMYLSVNFRWPLGQSLMGNNSGQSSSQIPASMNSVHSAFKTVSSNTSINSTTSLAGSCSKDLMGPSSIQQGNMIPGLQQSLPPPPPHPAMQMGHSSQSVQGMGLCPPSYHGIHHTTGHSTATSTQQSSMSAMEDRMSMAVPMSMSGLGGMSMPGKDILAPSIPPPPPPPAASTHPAFPVPMWLQQSQAAAATAYNFSHLQQVFGHEKALAASQYFAAADPFAKAAAPFLDLARMGHYPLGKKLFGCPQCRYITDRKNNLKRHIATMHQECDKTLECCGVVFKNKASLRDHVLIFHSNGYMCRFCGRNFCRKALLKRHLTVHSGQKDYICSLCDYATSHKSNLERHKKVHERQSQDGTDDPETNTASLQKTPDSTSTRVSSSSDHHLNIHTSLNKDLSSIASLPKATSSPRTVFGHDLPLGSGPFSPSMADTSFTSDSLTENDDDLPLSPINVDDDPNALIDVVELAN